MLVFVECKHLRRPVERDAMLILLQKLHSVGAHKGIVFSTSGFQAGENRIREINGIGAPRSKVHLPRARRLDGREGSSLTRLTSINRVPRI